MDMTARRVVILIDCIYKYLLHRPAFYVPALKNDHFSLIPNQWMLPAVRGVPGTGFALGCWMSLHSSEKFQNSFYHLYPVCVCRLCLHGTVQPYEFDMKYENQTDLRFLVCLTVLHVYFDTLRQCQSHLVDVWDCRSSQILV